MTQYRVIVAKDTLTFAAGHFLSYAGSPCEVLHGHNYRVGVTIVGELDEDGLVFDFDRLKDSVERLLQELDHKMMLQTESAEMSITTEGDSVHVEHGDRSYTFPLQDVVFVPIANTTAELLAAHLADRLTATLRLEEATNLTLLEVEVEESFGQSAACQRVL